MNKHVLEHVPVSKLPDDIRRQLPGVETVTISAEDGEPEPMTAEGLLAAIKESQAAHRGRGVTVEEAVKRIRELRDEWDS